MLSSYSGVDFCRLKDEYKSLAEKQVILWESQKLLIREKYKSAVRDWEYKTVRDITKYDAEFELVEELKTECNQAYTECERIVEDILLNERNEYTDWLVLEDAIKNLNKFVTNLSTYARYKLFSARK